MGPHAVERSMVCFFCSCEFYGDTPAFLKIQGQTACPSFQPELSPCLSAAFGLYFFDVAFHVQPPTTVCSTTRARVRTLLYGERRRRKGEQEERRKKSRSLGGTFSTSREIRLQGTTRDVGCLEMLWITCVYRIEHRNSDVVLARPSWVGGLVREQRELGNNGKVIRVSRRDSKSMWL